MMKALIDADIVVYRAGFAAQRTVYVLKARGTGEVIHQYDVGITLTEIKQDLAYDSKRTQENFVLSKKLLVSPPAFACNNAKKIINEILENTGCDEYEMFLTSEDKSNFRYQVAKTLPYKGNRKPDGKPQNYKVIREYLINYWDAKVVYGAEADDVLLLKHNENTVLASIDKDLTQKPGKYYNIAKKTMKVITERQAEVSFYAQLILGDTTDNIPGLKTLMSTRCGKQTIRKWLSDYDTYPEGDAWFYDTLRHKAKWKVDFDRVEKLKEEIVPLIRIGYEPDLKNMRIE